MPNASIHRVVDESYGAVHHQHVNAVRVHAPRGRLESDGVGATGHSFADQIPFAERLVKLVASDHVVGAGVPAVGADVVADQPVGPGGAGSHFPQGPDAAGIVREDSGSHFLDSHHVRQTVVELLDGERLVEPRHAVAVDFLDRLVSPLDVIACWAVGVRVPGVSRRVSGAVPAAVDCVAAPGKRAFGARDGDHPIEIVRAVVRVAGALHQRQLGRPGPGVCRIGDRQLGIERRGQLVVVQVGQEHHGPIGVDHAHRVVLSGTGEVLQLEGRLRAFAQGDGRKHPVRLMISLQPDSQSPEVVGTMTSPGGLPGDGKPGHHQRRRGAGNSEDYQHVNEGPPPSTEPLHLLLLPSIASARGATRTVQKNHLLAAGERHRRSAPPCGSFVPCDRL